MSASVKFNFTLQSRLIGFVKTVAIVASIAPFPAVLAALPASLIDEISAKAVLASTEDWQQLTESLQLDTGSSNARKFCIMQTGPSGSQRLLNPIAQYRSARYVRSLNPVAPILEGSRVMRGVTFGYRGGDKFKYIGPLSYLVINAEGVVTEVGCATEEIKSEIQSHVNRRTLSSGDQEQLIKLNGEFFEFLRNNPEGKKHLDAFTRERGLPEGFAEKMQLAFFSEDLTPFETSIKPWLKNHGYTLEQMQDAGWILRTFDDYGRPKYLLTDSNAIKIPLFADVQQTRIVRFRTRQLYRNVPNPMHGKYKSQLNNRSLDQTPADLSRFYNSWLLESARGKTIVITEGEFKAFTATEQSGIITVGLTGIFDYDRTILQTLVAAGAAKYVVLFDYDPLTSNNSAFRDGITNTQRGAYQLAIALEQMGAQRVAVGTLPGAAGKVGLDDMILALGREAGTREYQRIIDSAQAPNAYALGLQMDPLQEQLYFRRDSLAQCVNAQVRAKEPETPALVRAKIALAALNSIVKPLLKPSVVAIPSASIVPALPPEKKLIPILATDAGSWKVAQRAPVDCNLQVSLRPNIFGRSENVISDVLYRLPRVFPNLRLNAISNGISAQILGFPKLTLENARRLTLLLQGLSAEELSAARLLEPVKIVDPKKVQVSSNLREGVYRLGLKVSPEFQGWRNRLIKLITKTDPTLGVSIQTSSLIELVDLEGLDGKALQGVSVRKSLSALRKMVNAVTASNQDLPEIFFQWQRTPIDLAATDAHSSKAVLFSYRANTEGVIEIGPVCRWTSIQIGTTGRSYQQMVEFYTLPFLQGKPDPTRSSKQDSNTDWISSFSEHAKTDFDGFIQKSTPKLRTLVTQERSGLSRSSLPSLFIGEHGEQIFHRTKTMQSFAPEKAVPLAPVIEQISLPQSDTLTGGYAVYGSTTNRAMAHPADSDLLYNGVIHVPTSIRTREEAVLYARKAYVSEVLGHFARLAKNKRIVISEVRIGSNRTMSLPSGSLSPADDFKDHPYLTQDDFLQGRYRDSQGKVWTLEELVSLDDFAKMKFDFYHEVNSKIVTQCISLQFLMAYDWKGEVHFMRSAALKGFPNSPVSTAAYYGADAYAVALLLERPMGQNASQYGPIEVLSIREILIKGWDHYKRAVGYLTEPPLFSTKFLKEYHRKISFYQLNDAAFESAIFEDTKQYMQKLGVWDSTITFGRVSQAVLSTINSEEVSLLNRLKSVVNDLREFNERDQEMKPSFWVDRKLELLGNGSESLGLFGQIHRAIESGGIRPSPEFLKAMNAVEAILDAVVSEGGGDKAANKMIIELGIPKSKKTNGNLFAILEKAIPKLQHQMHTDPGYAGALPKPIADYIHFSTALSPHISSRFVRARFQLSDQELALRYQLLGIDPTPENIATMKKIDNIFDSASPEQVRKLQEKILVKSPVAGPHFIAGPVINLEALKKAPVKWESLLQSIRLKLHVAGACP